MDTALSTSSSFDSVVRRKVDAVINDVSSADKPTSLQGRRFWTPSLSRKWSFIASAVATRGEKFSTGLWKKKQTQKLWLILETFLFIDVGSTFRSGKGTDSDYGRAVKSRSPQRKLDHHTINSFPLYQSLCSVHDVAMGVNPIKTDLILFIRKHKPDKFLPTALNGVSLSSEGKYLGTPTPFETISVGLTNWDFQAKYPKIWHFWGGPGPLDPTPDCLHCTVLLQEFSRNWLRTLFR